MIRDACIYVILLLYSLSSVYGDMFPIWNKNDNFVLRKEVTTISILNIFATDLPTWLVSSSGTWAAHHNYLPLHLMLKRRNNQIGNDILELVYKVIFRLQTVYSHPNSFSCLSAGKFFCIVLSYGKGHVFMQAYDEN